MVTFKYNLRSLAARKRTAAAAVFGVALVTLVLASSLMLAEGVARTLGASGRDDTAIVLRKGSSSELTSAVDEASAGLVFAAPGVLRDDGRPLGAAELVAVAAMPKLGAVGISNVLLRGVTEGSRSLRPGARVIEGRLPTPGSAEALLGVRLRGRFRGLALGQSFELRKNRPVTIVGVFSDEGDASESEVWIDRDTLQAAFGRHGNVSSVRVRLDSAERFEAFRAAIEQDPRLGLMVERETIFLERQSEGLSLFIRIMGAVVAVFFSVGAMIGATITMHGAVANRQREIGTLRALGFSRRSILMGFLLEAVALTLIGGGLGALLSLGMSFVKVSMINFASWSELVFTFTPTAGILARSLIFAAGMGLLGGFFPALRAARISPLAAMRG